MIVIANINNINPADYDKVYICMRSIDSLTKDVTDHKNVIHLPVLSPSTELFWWYRDIKKKFKWTETVFREQYVPRFLDEMQSNEARWYLTQLIYESESGLKIAVCCSCLREDMCHRSILAGLFRCNGTSAGTDVVDIYETPLLKYNFYYDQYKTIEASLS